MAALRSRYINCHSHEREVGLCGVVSPFTVAMPISPKCDSAHYVFCAINSSAACSRLRRLCERVHQAQCGHPAPGRVTSSATKVSPQLQAGTKPFSQVDETILKPKTF